MKGAWRGVGGLGLMVEGWGISNQRLFCEAALKVPPPFEVAIKAPPSICEEPRKLPFLRVLAPNVSPTC